MGIDCDTEELVRSNAAGIDCDTEELIRFSAARSAFPGRDSIALQTLHRWRTQGVRGTKLETCLVGGLRMTSREAISRFLTAQNRDDSQQDRDDSQPTTPAITANQRQRQSTAARQALAAAGI